MSNDLNIQITIAIAEKLRAFEHTDESVEVDGVLYSCHWFHSAHEIGYALLWHLGIAVAAAHFHSPEWSDAYYSGKITKQEYNALCKTRPLAGGLTVEKYEEKAKYYGVPEGFPAYFYILNPASYLEILKQHRNADWPEEKELISAYINLDAEYGEPLLPVPKETAFEVTDARQIRALNALSKAGFVTAHEGKYTWTSKIESIMRELFIWE